MIALIVPIRNDYILTTLYGLIIVALLFLRKEKNDILILVVGGIAMTISESFFIATGVEVFQRNSLFGLMPLWLPLLWAYGFIVISRSLGIINR
jgi:cadmium resistance protein CadD (predicted permease)